MPDRRDFAGKIDRGLGNRADEDGLTLEHCGDLREAAVSRVFEELGALAVRHLEVLGDAMSEVCFRPRHGADANRSGSEQQA